MQMPEAPLTPDDNDGKKTFSYLGYDSPPLECDNQEATREPLPHPKKRHRPEELDFHPGPPLKRMYQMTEKEYVKPFGSIDGTVVSSLGASQAVAQKSTFTQITNGVQVTSEAITYNQKSGPSNPPSSIGVANQRIVTRDFMWNLIGDVLKTDHPTSEHTSAESGELIEVKIQGSRGETRDCNIRLIIEPDVPEAILTDQQHLQFSISKVIDNAIKFSDGGTITITVKLSQSLQMIEIWVVDTGCGITEESKSRLFQPHFQENATISRSKDGLGLSLFNAKAHVRKNLGGDVTLERSATDGPSKGSAFLIRLPVSTLDLKRSVTPTVGSPPTNPNNTEVALSSVTTTSTSMSIHPPTPGKLSRRQSHNSGLAKSYPLNILVAEDNPVNRRFVCAALNRLGYGEENITLAFDGEEAVRVYKESLSKPAESRFHIILMDIWMPTMDGYEATREILKLAEGVGENTTVIAVTADITDDCTTRSREAGMQGFLAKPYKVLDIEKVIIEHFGHHL